MTYAMHQDVFFCGSLEEKKPPIKPCGKPPEAIISCCLAWKMEQILEQQMIENLYL
jgi:hypothetical protein